MPAQKLPKTNFLNIANPINPSPPQQLPLDSIKYPHLAKIITRFNFINSLSLNPQSFVISHRIPPYNLFEILLTEERIEHHIQEYLHQIVMIFEQGRLVSIHDVIVCRTGQIL